jgi:hypothetical protein
VLKNALLNNPKIVCVSDHQRPISAKTKRPKTEVSDVRNKNQKPKLEQSKHG